MMKIISLFIILFISYSHAADSLPENAASESSAPTLALPEEKFAGIVQYTEGKLQYDFKDLITFDKTITIPKKSYMKVITQKRCIAVFYENSKIQSPIDKVSPWKILSGNARWICPESKVEKVMYKDSELQVQNGEFLLANNELLSIRDSVLFDNKNLELNKIYVYKNSKWTLLDDQPEPYDLWEKHKKFPAPQESAHLKKEVPQDPYVARVFLNVAPIGISGFYHHGLENKVSDYELETHFFRLGTNFPWKGRSVLVFLEYDETDGDNNNNGSTPIGAKDINVETATLGVGLRHSHVKSSSFYYFLGLSRINMRFHLHPDNLTYHDGEITFPWNATAGAGYQKIFWAKSWMSLMVGWDFKITQSLSKGNVDRYNGPPLPKDPEDFATSYSTFLYLGPVFNF